MHFLVTMVVTFLTVMLWAGVSMGHIHLSMAILGNMAQVGLILKGIGK